MKLYSSLLVREPFKINHGKIAFKLQIYYSHSLEFRELDSLAATEVVTLGKHIQIGFYLPNSPNFLRIDPGSFFSVHKNPQFDIIRLHLQEEVERISCTPEQVSILSHQLHTEVTSDGSWMVCGCDPHYIFKNPFSGHDISFIFKSQLVLGL